MVECPHCNDDFDLFDTTLNDEGFLLRDAIPDGCWSQAHEDFKETISCPWCLQPVEVEEIEW